MTHSPLPTSPPPPVSAPTPPDSYMQNIGAVCKHPWSTAITDSDTINGLRLHPHRHAHKHVHAHTLTQPPQLSTGIKMTTAMMPTMPIPVCLPVPHAPLHLMLWCLILLHSSTSTRMFVPLTFRHGNVCQSLYGHLEIICSKYACKNEPNSIHPKPIHL